MKKFIHKFLKTLGSMLYKCTYNRGFAKAEIIVQITRNQAISDEIPPIPAISSFLVVDSKHTSSNKRLSFY